MEDKELIELGKAQIKKKKKIYLIIGLSLLGLMLIGILGSVLPGITEGSSKKVEINVGGLVGSIVLFGLSAIVMFVLVFLLSRKSDADLMKIGEAIEKKNIASQERKEKAEAEKAEKLSSITPDFEAEKEFKAAKAFVWINTHSKLIQFSLPSGVVDSKDKGKFFGWLFNSKKPELMNKTKILNLADLENVDLGHDSQTVQTTDIQGGTYRGDTIGSGSGRINTTTTTYHYYQVVFTFKDIDHPVIHIYFNNDGEQAESLYQTVKLLTRK